MAIITENVYVKFKLVCKLGNKSFFLFTKSHLLKVIWNREMER